MRNIILSLMICILSCSCERQKIITAWKIANDSKNPELARFLSFYKNKRDSKRYRAACYLINNIRNKYYVDPKTSMVIYDEDIINADSLIFSLETSFDILRTSPYLKKYSFSDFCEYILPYRITNEPLTYYWKVACRAEISADKDIKNTALRINNRTNFEIISSNYGDHLKSFSSMVADQYGKCDDRANLLAMKLRAIGIPAAVEIVPYWGNHNNGHAFVSVILPNGELFPLVNGQNQDDNYLSRKAPKIYRYTYKTQNKSYINDKSAHSIFENRNLMDVTQLHDIISVTFHPTTKSLNPSYLGVFVYGRWEPITMSKKSKFEHIGIGGNSPSYAIDEGEGILYISMKDSMGVIIPYGHPIVLSKDSHLTLVPTKEYETVRLERKYPLSYRVIDFAQNMRHGKFELSKEPDFSNSIEFTIEDTPLSRMQNIEINDKGKYQYLRYYKKKGIFSIAELKVVGLDSCKLTGTPIADPCIKGTKSYLNVFDNDPLTYFEVNSDFDIWLGIDLNTPTEISKITFAPRNDDNAIYPGNEYELFYWDTQWVSLGKQIATEYYLEYSVPSNALFWLKNLTRGHEERPFTIKNNKQIWW